MSPMRRIQAFEIHDLDRCPAFVRQTVVESLGLALRITGVCRVAAGAFRRFVQRTGARRVLDLCSGSGEPIALLLDALHGVGAVPPQFVLSDLHPHLAQLDAVAARHAPLVEVVRRPVDATRVPPDVDADARTIFNALHHFPPRVVRALLADSAARGQPLFVFEAAVRRPLRSIGMLGAVLAGAAVNPVVTRRHRLLKAVATWGVPLLPGVLLWDSCVSYLRQYRLDELRALASGLDPGWSLRHEVLRSGPLLAATVVTWEPAAAGAAPPGA